MKKSSLDGGGVLYGNVEDIDCNSFERWAKSCTILVF